MKLKKSAFILTSSPRGRRHGVDWGGYVHPTFLMIDFLIRLNSMEKGWGGAFFPSQRSVLLFSRP